MARPRLGLGRRRRRAVARSASQTAVASADARGVGLRALAGETRTGDAGRIGRGRERATNPTRASVRRYTAAQLRAADAASSKAGEFPLVEPALTRRYEICASCGGNNRCAVYKAFDRDRRRFVALKVLVNCFGDAISAQRAYREVAYLHALRGHPNVARLRRAYVAETGVHAAVVLDFYATDLRHACVADRLLPAHRTFVARQLFSALAFVHAARIAHRDVRPSNIVLDERCRAQLVDFASARFVGGADADFTISGPRSTDDAGAACYRPVESLLGSPLAGARAGDVWAAGCVLVEMETTVFLVGAGSLARRLRDFFARRAVEGDFWQTAVPSSRAGVATPSSRAGRRGPGVPRG